MEVENHQQANIIAIIVSKNPQLMTKLVSENMMRDICQQQKFILAKR